MMFVPRNIDNLPEVLLFLTISTLITLSC